jgi:RpiR family carbohydrate utilization transcriptional regulator
VAAGFINPEPTISRSFQQIPPMPGTGDTSLMLNDIEARKGSFRKSERKVADYVLARPNGIIQISIAALARAVGVSEPTVIRFCHAVGCKGFTDFKLRLAQSLASNVRYFHHDVLPEPFAETNATKVFDVAVSTLLRVRNHLDEPAMGKAIEILADANRIELYGIGISGITASCAQHKFLLLGLPAYAHSDPYTHGLAASLLKRGDAVVVLSESGEETELLHTVEAARKAGAEVIGLTVKASPLAQCCSVCLAVDIDGQTDVYRRNALLIAQLVVIDALQASIALRQGSPLGGRFGHGGERRRDDT